jgi:hypothetical protein
VNAETNADFDWTRIDDAIARGDAIHPNAWARLDAILAPRRPVAAIIVEIPTNHAEPRLHQQSDMETIGDRVGVGGDGNGVDVAIIAADHADAGNDGNGNVETVINDVVLALPEASRGEGGNDVFPRPKSRKGFSKELRRVWDWLDAHAATITHDDPVQRTVAEATNVSHPTAGKALKRWRDHNGITKPDYYHEQAS